MPKIKNINDSVICLLLFSMFIFCFMTKSVSCMENTPNTPKTPEKIRVKKLVPPPVKEKKFRPLDIQIEKPNKYFGKINYTDINKHA